MTLFFRISDHSEPAPAEPQIGASRCENDQSEFSSVAMPTVEDGLSSGHVSDVDDDHEQPQEISSHEYFHFAKSTSVNVHADECSGIYNGEFEHLIKIH